jgi:hypothetical protein
MKRISVSTINHHPTWDISAPPPSPVNLPKYNLSCSIYYKNDSKFELKLWDKVEFAEDRTEDCDVPDGEARGVEFFWEEPIGGLILRRMASCDRERSEYGKPWGWLGMFWLFESFNDAFYERTACGIQLTKFYPPEWPLPDYLK